MEEDGRAFLGHGDFLLGWGLAFVRAHRAGAPGKKKARTAPRRAARALVGLSPTVPRESQSPDDARSAAVA